MVAVEASIAPTADCRFLRFCSARSFLCFSAFTVAAAAAVLLPVDRVDALLILARELRLSRRTAIDLLQRDRLVLMAVVRRSLSCGCCFISRHCQHATR